MTTKIQLKRIEILIEELEKLRKENPRGIFDMGDWCALDSAPTKTELDKQIKEATKNPCGTAACLAGKAGLIPRIRQMGFRWGSRVSILGWDSYAYGGFRYKDYFDDNAIEAFFGEEVLNTVFYDTATINTLYQGIKALKKFIQIEKMGGEHEWV